MDGKMQNIGYHNYRVNNTRRILFQTKIPWDLSEIIQIPELNSGMIYRLRFNYSKEPEGFEIIPYVRRVVKKLYLMDCNHLDYSFKYCERTALENLRKSVPDPELSDVLIVKNGLITDTTFSNIALFDGTHWYTPSTPLLKGTKRELYIEKRIIQACDISRSGLFKYIKLRLINAMLDLHDSADIAISDILS